MDLISALAHVRDCPHDHAALSARLSAEVVDALLAGANAPYDEGHAGQLRDALGRVAWLFVESARRDFRPAVVKKGRVVTPAGDGPRDSRYPAVVLAQLSVWAEHTERSDDARPQSAFNTAIKVLMDLPTDEIAALATRIFRGHGERTGERLSLDEAFFCFPSNVSLPPSAGSLRAALAAFADERGWPV